MKKKLKELFYLLKSNAHASKYKDLEKNQMKSEKLNKNMKSLKNQAYWLCFEGNFVVVAEISVWKKNEEIKEIRIF